ncbi:MAG: transglutaminase-like domain-containing protein [Betaproteobacteria bacterium]
MKVPPLLLGAALAFWGWRSGNYAAAAALALLAEAPHALAWRIELRPLDFSRIADSCTLFFAGMLVWLCATLEEPRTARAVLTTLLWLPAVLMPILLAQRFSSAGRMPLSALFRYLRKLKEREPSTPDPEVDLSGVYFAVCLVTAGIPNKRDELFYAGAVLLVAWALAAARPRHAARGAWAALVLAAAGIGYAAHSGLAELQASIENWVSDWVLRGIAADPYRTSTDLGSVGRLKEIETIVLRVYAGPAQAERVKLLHRSSFTTLAGTNWIARNAPMAPLQAEPDGTTWRIAAGEPGSRTRIVTRLEDGKALLALPAGTLRLSGLPAASVRRNAFGATLADLGGDWAPYVVETGAGEEYAPPREEDLQVPPREREAFARLFGGLSSRPHEQAVQAIQRHFAAFSYSLFREAPVPEGATPLADFIERAKSGHCEYFAGATTLALRAAGIPARYATGFAVVEWSELEGAYVVRARHAHAWTRAFVGGRWVDLDTTPPSWVVEEDKQKPAWQGLMDLLRWAGYRWSQRGALQGGPVVYALVALLAAVLAWRILRGKRAARAAAVAARRRAHPGDDSELYALEPLLAKRLGVRSPDQPLGGWMLKSPMAEQLRDVLELHYRYRFDPRGLEPAERAALRARCLALAQSLR